MKIRQEDSLTPLNTHQELVEEDTGKEPIEDESLGTMALPWKDLIVTEIVQSTLANPESCDSTLEIPWNDLVLEKPIEIQAPPEEACVNNDVEIPWNDILIPRNIVIEPQIKKKHPSSNVHDEQIRSKLPSVSFLKRLMRPKTVVRSERETNSRVSDVFGITESLVNRTILETSSAASINESPAEDEDSVDWTENLMVDTQWYDTHRNPSNCFTAFDSEEPSTSNTTNDAETEPVQMTSNFVNTSETMTLGEVFLDALTPNIIVAGNILEFAEAMLVPLGTQTERYRDQEPRIIPLVFIESEDRQELYVEGPVNGESGFSGSSTIGSEISRTSESEQPETRNRRIGQDTSPQLFDMSLNMIIRKPFFHQDDEPTIY
ncbi:hypothetical protein WN55_06000 [Dufourea novaeangliae]|uniref:Uncharacterized protein n=1 Tax=Dufourea novaeangliae TaxID=178035 RepID=A0A154P0V7_DUFNO|nr:hypothetical protein WN55_06000 [Dufourea novaeangliae]